MHSPEISINTVNTKIAMNSLLATAQVRVKSFHGEFVTLKALIDRGSQITSIIEETAKILQLPKTKTLVNLQGLKQTVH